MRWGERGSQALHSVSEWVYYFERMRADWHGTVRAATELDAVARNQAVSSWIAAFDDLRAEQDALRQSGRWVSGPADLLGVIGQSRRETYHSAILAWLLDPNMRHGLGTGFLERLIRRCFPDSLFNSLADAWTQCEVTRAGARADIVVWSTELTLVIENKVDAVEQPGQCDSYFDLFVEEPGARFLFLTPSGVRPCTASGEAAAAFQSVSYAAVKEELTAILDETSTLIPGPGRDVALQYLRTLEREFG